MITSLRRLLRSKQDESKPTATDETRPTNNDKNEGEDVLDVVIIGAGWAGLGAGRYFWEKQRDDFRFCILEGQTTIGGRSKTLHPISKEYADNSMLELGSQWIHGAHRRNRVFQLALKHDMLLHFDSGDDAWDSSAIWVDRVVDEGTLTIEDMINNPSLKKPPRRRPERMDPDIEDQLSTRLMKGRKGFYPFLFSYTARQKKQWKKDRCKDPRMPEQPPPASIRDVYDLFCEEKQLSTQDRKYLQYLLENDFTQEYAASVEDIDAEWCDHDKEYSGGDVHFGLWKEKADRGNVQGGYSELIRRFAEPLLKEGLIQCHCKVTSIDTSNEPVVIEYQRTTQRPDGESTTQHRMLADCVLCTVPLGALKAGSIQFRPLLPDAKTQAIQKLGMGIYNKVVFVWTPDQRSQLPWLFPLDGDEYQEERGKATRQIWVERISLPGEPQGPWSCCYTAHTHQRPDTPILLYFFLAGRTAQEMESLSDSETQEQALVALRDWFEDPHIPDPQQMIVTRWFSDPFTGGSYSFYKIGSSPEDRKELAKPLPNKRLYFAGEACHIKYYATTHGALMSGQETGKAVWKNHLNTSKERRRRKVNSQRD